MGTSEFNAGHNPADGLASHPIPSHPGGSRNVHSRFIPQKLEIGVGLMGHLA